MHSGQTISQGTSSSRVPARDRGAPPSAGTVENQLRLVGAPCVEKQHHRRPLLLVVRPVQERYGDRLEARSRSNSAPSSAVPRRVDRCRFHGGATKRGIAAPSFWSLRRAHGAIRQDRSWIAGRISTYLIDPMSRAPPLAGSERAPPACAPSGRSPPASAGRRHRRPAV